MSAARDYLSLPLREFLADVGSRSPTPGGGSVAAFVGALGAALAQMALAYSTDNRGSPGEGDPLGALARELRKAAERFTGLMDEDMAAYGRYAAARQASAEQKQQALLRAAAVPIEVISLAADLVARLHENRPLVNPRLLSDLQAAAILLAGAARAAATSARANLAALADRTEADRLGQRLDRLLRELAGHHDAILAVEAT